MFLWTPEGFMSPEYFLNVFSNPFTPSCLGKTFRVKITGQYIWIWSFSLMIPSKTLLQVLIITPKQNEITETGRIMEHRKWPKLNLGGFWSQVLINSANSARFIFLVFSRATRNFSGQGSFLGIRALRWTIIYATRKKDPQGKLSCFFSWKNIKIAL